MPGTQLWFQPHLCVWVTHRHLLPAKGRREWRQQPTDAHEPALLGGPPSACRGGGRHMGKEAALAACPLHVTLQWCFSSKELLSSSRSIPGCGAPQSHHLRLSLRSQQQSPPQACSPNPRSGPKLPSALADTHLRLRHAGLCMDHLCRSYSVLPVTD